MKEWPNFSLLIIGLAIPVLVFGASSTSITAVTTSPNQPYLLETGWVNYGGSAGAQTIITSKQCPTGFYPHINFSLFKLATSDFIQSTPGSAAVCPVAAYGTGASPYFYKTGSGSTAGYSIQFFTSGYQPSNIANAGILWEMNCFPGTTWLGATPEYDTSCSLPALGSGVRYSRTYSFTALSDTYVKNNMTVYFSQVLSSSAFQIPLAPLPNWDSPITIPYAGTYKFVLYVPLITQISCSSGAIASCFTFYLTNTGGGFIDYLRNSGTGLARVDLACGQAGGPAGLSMETVETTVAMTQGATVKVWGTLNPSCGFNPGYVLSSGYLYIERVGN